MSVIADPRHGPPAAGARVATPAGTARPAYVGLVTRAMAFALDAAIVNGVAIAVTAVVTLTLSVVTVPDAAETALIAAGGALYLLWTVAYFATFWSTTGQTPGSRLLRIRVTDPAGGTLRPRRAVLRFAALTLAAIPLGAGFWLILVEARRRGLHDVIARSVVVDASARAANGAARR